MPDLVRGDVIGYYVRRLAQKSVMDSPWYQVTPPVHNDPLYGAAVAAQRLFRGSEDLLNYRVTGAYIEFDNSGDPVDPVPSVTRDGGLSYYDALSGDRDYLRVGIGATSEENTDETKYEAPNRSIFHIYTSGSTGVNGLPFSNGAGSRVYGGALVAVRDIDDASKDIVLARFYFPSANQLVKLVGSDIGLRWRWTFS